MQPTGDSQSYVTELGIGANGLSQVGQIAGLGHGQQIYSVRFVQDAGYVVTFRRVDPLYTLALVTRRRHRSSGSSSSRATRPTCIRSVTGCCSVSATMLVRATSRPGGCSSCSTSRRPLRRDCSPRPPSARARQRRCSTTTTRSCTGLRPGSRCCRLRSTRPSRPVPRCLPQRLPRGSRCRAARGPQPPPASRSSVPSASRSRPPGSPSSPASRMTRSTGTRRRSGAPSSSQNHLSTLSQAGLMASDLATLARQSFLAFPQPPAPVVTCGPVGVAPGARAGGASGVAIVPCAG